MVEFAKYNAWIKLKGIKKELAMEKYIEFINEKLNLKD